MSKNTIENSITTISTLDLTSVMGGQAAPGGDGIERPEPHLTGHELIGGFARGVANDAAREQAHHNEAVRNFRALAQDKQ